MASRYYPMKAFGDKHPWKVELRRNIRVTKTGISYSFPNTRYFKLVGLAVAAAKRGNARLKAKGELFK